MKFDSPEYIYRRTFYLPVFSNDFDAAFFPEGGPLSPVLLQNIAFKILGADGLSREAAGYVLNARGDTLMHICSEHDGMGSFTLTPVAGESYHAILTSSDHVIKRFDLLLSVLRALYFLLSVTSNSYTPDSTSPEDVVIEGVDRNGKVCRYVTTINQYTE